ncbi:MAG: ABC transporter permease [Treponema sp.]|jgi:ABC-type nitrate/sulfonate/bicarbonate transport system permease component|nr:ABC transporter permease [Treponema sp.]
MKPKAAAGPLVPPALPPLLCLVALWQAVSVSGMIPRYMLPGPLNVLAALWKDRFLLAGHLGRTMAEAAAGLGLAVAVAFILAVIMDTSRLIKDALGPLLLFTQTMPTVALAPLLILWMGYGAAPKIALVFLTCFFPLTLALLGAFSSADEDELRLLKSMGANSPQLYRYIKIPSSAPAFFSGLRVSTSYSIIGAVISVWLGGDAGLGVYMIRVRKSYSFDKMFAAILVVALLSLALMKLVECAEKAATPWRNGNEVHRRK